MSKKEDTALIRLSTIWYGIKQGYQSMMHNGLFTLASVGTITACLFLFGVFYCVTTNLEYMIYNAQSNVGITVLFDEGTTEEQIAAIGEQIVQNTAVEEEDLKYTSAEDAWKQFSSDLSDTLVESFGKDNPLKDSASYTISLKNVNKQSELVKYIEQIDGVRKVNRSDVAANAISGLSDLVKYISTGIIILLLIVSIFLISITVTMGITVRKEEIGIMKLIGATDFFVRGPFIVEGLLIGIAGAFGPILILYLLYGRAIEFVKTSYSSLKDVLVFMSAGQVFPKLIPMLLAMGIGIGLLGSTLTVRKHLKI